MVSKHGPLLHFELHLPLLHMSFGVMRERLELNEREYISISIILWVWRLGFRLYDTYKSRWNTTFIMEMDHES